MASRLWFRSMVLLAAVPFYAAPGGMTKVFNYPADKISLELPSNWEEMPVLQLQQIREAANRMVSGFRTTIDYRHGFVPGPRTRGSRAAYILVVFVPRRTLSERDLKDPERVRRLQNRALDAMGKEGAGVNRSNSSFSGSRYDASRHVQWQESAVRDTDGNLIRGLSGLYLTREGMVQVHCYAFDRAYASFAPQFQKIIESLHLDRSLEYRPSIWDRLPVGGSTATVRLATYGVLFLLTALALSWVLVRVLRPRGCRPGGVTENGVRALRALLAGVGFSFGMFAFLALLGLLFTSGDWRRVLLALTEPTQSRALLTTFFMAGFVITIQNLQVRALLPYRWREVLEQKFQDALRRPALYERLHPLVRFDRSEAQWGYDLLWFGLWRRPFASVEIAGPDQVAIRAPGAVIQRLRRAMN